MDQTLIKYIQLLQAGDESSFDFLREQYAALLLSMVSATMTKSPDAEFEDLMQEATLALYHAAMSYDLQQDAVTFGLYAKICIRNRMNSALRKLRRSLRSDSDRRDKSVMTSTQRKSARRASLGNLSVLVDAQFSEFEKSVYRLYLQGYSAVEISEQLNRTPKSIDNAIYRLRRKIKQDLPQ